MGRPCLAPLKEPPESFAVVDRRPLRETKSEGHVFNLQVFRGHAIVMPCKKTKQTQTQKLQAHLEVNNQ